MRIKSKTNIDYLDLISSIKATRVLLQEIARGDTTDTYCYDIRHDVDYELSMRELQEFMLNKEWYEV